MDGRTAVVDALGRIRAGAWSAAQCGIAAALAWATSSHVLGHSRPFFAAVAAVVALGLSGSGRLRRTAELSLGVALGVGVGDLFVGLVGQGAWQIGVVVFIALLLAIAVGAKGLAVSQAGLQAVFVVALPRTPNSGLHRWQDALVGGAAALLVAALLPSDPWREAKRLRSHYFKELAEVVRQAARGLRSESEGEVAEALARSRAMEPVLARWQEALATGRETTRLSPFREDRGEFWENSSRLLVQVTRASRNLRVLLRRVTTSEETGQPLPAAVPDLLDELAAAIELAAVDDDAISPLVELAARLDPAALGAQSLSAQVVVGQLRVTVVDLLDGLGLEHDRARNALPPLTA
ncbi:MAG: hypothetical protein JWM02_1273 [Frankiales bacterium]|nr:hypothetical protein [Frankiales bacterium]